MSGICLDRLIAIMLYGRYNLIVTVRRIRFFTLFCWITFFLLNSAFILLKFCCLIAPLKNNQFYTFGYGEFETKGPLNSSLLYKCALSHYECATNKLSEIIFFQKKWNPVGSAPLTRSRGRTLRWKWPRSPFSPSAIRSRWSNSIGGISERWR